MKDLVDQHQPDLLYSDGGVPFDEVGLNLIAHLYNTSAALHGGVNEAVYNQKDTKPEVYRVGVLDIERGQRPDIAEDPWQTDTCVGGWFFDSRAIYKTPGHVIEMLVDIVSKNGNLLLNLPQMPDGTLDEECLWILESLSAWFEVNGDGIYGTRPWRVAGEGPARPEAGAFKETAVSWSPEDFKFTSVPGTVYAFQMKRSADGAAAIKSLSRESGLTVSGVSVLGSGAPLKYDQAEQALVLHIPEDQGSSNVPCLAVRVG
jgi:alpha-L-fucosidase